MYLNYGRQEITEAQADLVRVKRLKESEVGRIVDDGFNDLPQHLQDVWRSPIKMNTGTFFAEASKYINIPYEDIWDAGTDVEYVNGLTIEST
jgi:hypothetical protein